MEKARRNILVKNNFRQKSIQKQKENLFLPSIPKHVTISLFDVINNKVRLEAGAFSIDAKIAVEQLLLCKYKSEKLYPNNNFVIQAFHAPRFKRKYMSKTAKNAIGFLGSAEMLDVKPKVNKLLHTSQAQSKNLYVKKGTVLISCSGTIGKTTFVNETLEKYAFSQHIIRLICNNYPGYVYAYLNTKIAQDQIQSLIYGAVVPEIEPEHLKKILIPNPPEKIKKEIHELIVESFDLRDQSNELIDRAEKILYEELLLPPIEQLEIKYFDNSKDIRNFQIKLSKLELRLDGSYHIPIIEKILIKISENCSEIVNLSRLSSRIILAGVFKRTYVDEEYGIPFLGGRDITQLKPKVEKFLSKAIHKDRIIKELGVFENYILISDRGTIGKIQIVPKHWEGWTVSQNIIKVIPVSNDIAGYLYSFLNSDYGQILIKREAYGSVIDMIDDKNVARIKIPLLKDKIRQKEINDLVLKANDIRFNAHLLEQKALKMIEESVIQAT